MQKNAVNKQVMTSQDRTMTPGFVSTKLNGAHLRLCTVLVQATCGTYRTQLDRYMAYIDRITNKQSLT